MIYKSDVCVLHVCVQAVTKRTGSWYRGQAEDVFYDASMWSADIMHPT